VLRDLAYGLYSRKLRRELSGVTLPRHVGLIMDSNRRWARPARLRASAAEPRQIGHRVRPGAEAALPRSPIGRSAATV